MVSLLSWEIFDSQPAEYRSSVLPPGIPRFAIEAACSFGWERYVGGNGGIHSLPGFGASAALKDLQEHFGYTPEAIAGEAEKII